MDDAVRIVDSLCYAHSLDQELVGVIRVEFIDWVKDKSNIITTKNYLLAFRRVKEPFYQKYLLENYFYYGPENTEESLLYKKVVDSTASSLLNKIPSAENYQLRGERRFGTEDYKDALADFENALRLSYGKPSLELLDYVASTYDKLNNYPEAIKYYTMALDSAKDRKRVLWHRGLCKRELEDYRGALSDFSKALQSHDSRYIPLSDYFLFSVMASCKLSLGEYLDAKVILNKITPKLIADGDAGYIYYMKGFADYNLNYKESACANWSKAGEHGYTEAYDAIKSYCNKR